MDAGIKDRPDFMSYILRYNDHRGLTPEEIFENANFLVVAGSETTASLLSGLVFYLLKHPDIYDKLVNEIRSAFNSQEEISLDGVGRLDYMLAVLKEGLRICKSTPFPPTFLLLLLLLARLIGPHQALRSQWNFPAGYPKVEMSFQTTGCLRM
jgi:cytochrome P450